MTATLTTLQLPDLSDAAAHDILCALARTLAAGSRVIFRYTVKIDDDPIDLADYLGVRGFALVSDAPDGGPYRIAEACRRADRKSCCRLHNPLS